MRWFGRKPKEEPLEGIEAALKRESLQDGPFYVKATSVNHWPQDLQALYKSFVESGYRARWIRFTQLDAHLAEGWTTLSSPDYAEGVWHQDSGDGAEFSVLIVQPPRGEVRSEG